MVLLCVGFNLRHQLFGYVVENGPQVTVRCFGATKRSILVICMPVFQYCGDTMKECWFETVLPFSSLSNDAGIRVSFHFLRASIETSTTFPHKMNLTFGSFWESR
jgi:hypothetical protein